MTSTNTPEEIGSGCNGPEVLLLNPESSRIGASPSDAVLDTR